MEKSAEKKPSVLVEFHDVGLLVKLHDFEEDPQSGSGNCICGAALEHVRHPHIYRRSRIAALMGEERCVCTRGPKSIVHPVDTI